MSPGPCDDPQEPLPLLAQPPDDFAALAREMTCPLTAALHHEKPFQGLDLQDLCQRKNGGN
jgi:hypothetical protein